MTYRYTKCDTLWPMGSLLIGRLVAISLQSPEKYFPFCFACNIPPLFLHHDFRGCIKGELDNIGICKLFE